MDKKLSAQQRANLLAASNLTILYKVTGIGLSKNKRKAKNER